MSNSQWHQDQAEGERAMRVLEEQRKADHGQAGVAAELRALLSAFIDATVLSGHVVTVEEWSAPACCAGDGARPSWSTDQLAEESHDGQRA